MLLFDSGYHRTSMVAKRSEVHCLLGNKTKRRGQIPICLQRHFPKDLTFSCWVPTFKRSYHTLIIAQTRNQPVDSQAFEEHLQSTIGIWSKLGKKSMWCN